MQIFNIFFLFAELISCIIPEEREIKFSRPLLVMRLDPRARLEISNKVNKRCPFLTFLCNGALEFLKITLYR